MPAETVTVELGSRSYPVRIGAGARSALSSAITNLTSTPAVSVWRWKAPSVPGPGSCTITSRRWRRPAAV
ncbi:MAG: hypothetical protein ACKORI_08905, partial [Verrucomicrobiota bacterium]